MLPLCLLYQTGKRGALDENSGVMLKIGDRIFFLPLKSQSKKMPFISIYEASNKSISIKIQISKEIMGYEGADYFGTVDVLFRKETKRYRVSYYRGS